MIKRFISCGLLILIIAFSVSCEQKKDNKSFSKTYYNYFDTVITIKAYNIDKNSFNSVCDLLESELLEKYNQLFDIYNNYKGVNNIKTINDNAGIKKIQVDEELTDFLDCCKKMYNVTKGNVNICLGSVLSVWHKYRDEGKKVPEKSKLEKANSFTDINNLVINKKNNTVYLRQKGCNIDVGAIAKGYVTDKINSYLIAHSVTSAVVNFGGNILTVGKKPYGDDFSVGIANPKDNRKNIITLKCSNGLIVSTSGDYERYYEVNGKKYCHIISPITLFPPDRNKSVTVISNCGYLADVMSTALFILNYDDGLDLVNKTDDCEACIVDSSMKVYYSYGFKEFIK